MNITAAKEMPIDAGAAYVLDPGYYDYGWWRNSMMPPGDTAEVQHTP